MAKQISAAYNIKDYHLRPQVQNNYEQAINRYNAKKNAFLTTIGLMGQANEQALIQNLNVALNSNGTKLSPKEEKNINNAFDEVEQYITNAYIAPFWTNAEVSGSKEEQLIKVFREKLKSGKQDTEEQKSLGLEEGGINRELFYKRMRDNIDIYLEGFNMKNFLTDKLKGFSSKSASNQNTVVQQYMGYARRTLLNLLINGQLSGGDTNPAATATINRTKFIEALGGFYREEAVIKAFREVMKKWGGLSAYNVGAIRDSSGAQIDVDIMVTTPFKNGNFKNFLTTRLDKMQKSLQQVGKGIVTGGIDTIGIQSKSWIAPFHKLQHLYKGANTKFLNIGSDKALSGSFSTDKFFNQTIHGIWNWSYSAMMASYHIDRLLGENNVFFSTGDGIYYTGDLIEKFYYNHGYYLAFYVSTQNFMDTGDVVWEKPRANIKILPPISTN